MYACRNHVADLPSPAGLATGLALDALRDPPLPHHPCSPGDAHVTQPQNLSTCCTQQRVHDGRGAGGCRHRTLVRWGNGGPPTHAHTDHTRTHGPQRWPGYSPPPQ